jgi:hypothetical protein
LELAAEVAAVTVFHNGYEWWVARDLEHLRELYRNHTGLELEDADAEGDGWQEWPNDKPISVWTGEDGAPPQVTLMPAEWVAREGAGYLCGTEY